jgi:hypothetical protein
MIKIILVATAALAVGAIAALAIAASTSPETHAGGWCLETSVQNGHDAITGKFIPRTMFFRRGTDCPEDDQVAIRLEDGELAIEGDRFDLHFAAR